MASTQCDLNASKSENERLLAETVRLTGDIESLKKQQHLEADGLAKQLTEEKEKVRIKI